MDKHIWTGPAMKNRNIQLIGFVMLLVVAVAAAVFLGMQRLQRLEDPPPNIVFVLVDDMDYTLLPYIERTNRLVGQEGAVFTNYFVTSSACCPSRASTLRGQYPHNTGILENSPGFEEFHRNGNDEETIAVWMRAAGYRNSFMGKYMNLYPAGVKRSYIPRGWTDWHVFLYHISSDFYFGYTMNENGKLVSHGRKAEDYSTDVLRDRALEFIERSARRRLPFFLFISPYAPHGPSVPAPRHADLYPDLVYPKSPSFHEEDTSDKPFIIRDLRRTGGLFETEEADALFVRRVQTMQAVDEMVADIIQLLEENGQLENTYIFFTSDNGFHMGEHSLPSGKMLAYEEDIRVPFMVRGPGIRPGTTVTQMTANIDLAPTFAELAGAEVADFVDGRSFVPFLFGQAEEVTDWRKALLLETGYLDRESHVIAYRGIRAEDFTYVEYESGELEFYDLTADPYQLDNLAGELDAETLSLLHSWLEQLTACQAEGCRAAETALPDILK
jgi:N-acetylglucosamine-6-sulfatase